MPKKWVVNASPLIVLARINHLFLLQHVAEGLVGPAGIRVQSRRYQEYAKQL